MYYCLQFFYAIASTKSSNVIVLCMAEIMVSIESPVEDGVAHPLISLAGYVFCVVCAAHENEHASGVQVMQYLPPCARYHCLSQMFSGRS